MRTEKHPTWAKLRRAPDYRSFLQAYLDESGHSLSDLARAAGFGRGFPGDVISGRRRLTAKSYAAFECALKLPLRGRKFFRYLVARDEKDLFPTIDPQQIATVLQDLRKRPWTRARSRDASTYAKNGHSPFTNPDTFAVYAAAGSPDQGADRAKIAARTGLQENEIDRAVEGLVRAELLTVKDGLYLPRENHVFLKTRQKDEDFASLFQTFCERASEKVANSLHSEEELFFTSSFCVDEKQLPELKRALRKTILQFVDDSIDPNGESVMQLETAFFRSGRNLPKRLTDRARSKLIRE